jgi:hypothetical protein
VNLAYDNLFEALPPKIPIEVREVWYQHPIHPYILNELGEIRSLDPQIEFLESDFWTYKPKYGEHTKWPGHVRGVYNKDRILFQAYNNTKKRISKLYHLDGNPYNFRKDNIVGMGYGDPKLVRVGLENKYEFIRNTIGKIPLKLLWYRNYGWTAQDFFENFNLMGFWSDMYMHPKKIEQNYEEEKKTWEIALKQKSRWIYT